MTQDIQKNNLSFVISAAAIIIFSMVLRIIGIKFGLPMAYNNDEPVLVLATQQFFSGDFNPHNFLYPSFLMYVMHLVERIYYLFVATPPDLSTLYILSRLTVVLFGGATVWLLIVIGKTLFNKYVGLAAGLILAVAHLHVVNSHFATTDVPLTFFILLTLFFAMKLALDGSLKYYILTAVSFGLTVSIKIPGAVLFVSILIAHLYYVKKRFNFNYAEIFKRYARNVPFILLSFIISIIIGALVYLFFKNFAFFADRILHVVKIDLWLKYYDKIVLQTGLAAPKYALMFFVMSLFAFITAPVWFFKVKNLFLLVVVSVATFFLSTPYAILDFKTFARDFLFQVVISQTSWSGMFADKAPAFITNYFYLQNDFGLLLILLAAVGIISCLIKAEIRTSLIISFMVVYYAYLGTWKIMFDRYMVPLYPFIALFAVVGMIYLAEFVWGKLLKKLRRQYVVVPIFIILFVFPGTHLLKKSIGFDRYLLKQNTKSVAYDWAIEHLPHDAKILREQYAPELEIDGFNVLNVNFTFNDSVNVDYVRKHKIDYIIVTDKLWKRHIKVNGVLKQRQAYKKIPKYADLIYDLKPSKPHPGPEIKIYKVRKCFAKDTP
ncbi:MAG: phospholipid carrier-dependent glycosyltransferase [Calditrichaeota bacterium]|nr:phospholipid carrier-dependent glycosyltransferase [Calditrichota bacterium]